MDNEKLEGYMAEAIEEADKGIDSGHGGPFGTVIVNAAGEIVGRGHNRVLVDNDPTAHGEITAIRNACKNLGDFDLSGCTLFTTSYPCPMCLGAIMWSRIENVVYGCTIEDAKRIGFDDAPFYERFKQKNGGFKMISAGKKECNKLFDRYDAMNAKKY